MTNENCFLKLRIKTFVKFSGKSLCRLFYKSWKLDLDVIFKTASLFESTPQLRLMCVSISQSFIVFCPKCKKLLLLAD